MLNDNNCRSKFLIFGDYNLPNFNLKSGSIVPTVARAGSLESSVLAHISYLNFMQFNLIYNCCRSLLDLVFSNMFNINVINEIQPLLPLVPMYHPALTV